MDWIPVQSDDLKLVRYDAKTRTLEIEFKSGGIYQYNGIEEFVYHNLMNAASKGKFFHRNIKGKYPTTCLRKGH